MLCYSVHYSDNSRIETIFTNKSFVVFYIDYTYVKLHIGKYQLVQFTFVV